MCRLLDEGAGDDLVEGGTPRLCIVQKLGRNLATKLSLHLLDRPAVSVFPGCAVNLAAIDHRHDTGAGIR